MSKVTGRHIARLLSVDPSTVSRVLAGNSPAHRYDQRTVRRIRETASRLAYRPALAGRALRTGKTCLIGLLVSDIASPFFSELAGRIERHARTGQYRLLLCNTEESPAQQREHATQLLAAGVDGMIVAPSGADGLNEVLSAGVPLVTIDRPAKGLRVPHIGLDDRGAGEMLGQHLRGLGYHRIGVVTPPAQNDPGIDKRLAGLRRGLGGARAIAWCAECEPTESRQSAVVDLRSRLAGHNAVQALIGLNLLATLAAVRALADASLHIPGQIGLAGIDDFSAAPFLNPPVTVVSQPLEQIAATAVSVLMQWMENPNRKPPSTPPLLAPALTVRQSLRPLTESKQEHP